MTCEVCGHSVRSHDFSYILKDGPAEFPCSECPDGTCRDQAQGGRYVSPSVGSVDVPLCAPCADAQGVAVEVRALR